MTTTTQELNVQAIVAEAIELGKKAADATDDQGSNGSEAFQYVQLRVKGQRKVQNQLKKIAVVTNDHYYGYMITSTDALGTGYGYYKADAFTATVATYLSDNGITAYAADRCL